MVKCKKDCEAINKICNTLSGRCVDPNGKIGKKISRPVSLKSVLKKSRSASRSLKSILKKSRSASRPLKSILKKSRSVSRSKSRSVSRSKSRSVSRRSVLKKSKSRSVMHKSVFRSRGRRVPRQKDDEDVKKVDSEDILKARKVNRDRPSTLACVNKSKTHLTNIQTATADFFANDNVKSLLVVFGTGVGKTLLAITSAECYLQRHPTHNVIVLTTKTLVSNFENQFEKYGKVREDKYNIFSFNSYMNALKKETEYKCKNTLLIIDEI